MNAVTALQVDSLSVEVRARRLLDGVSFEAKRGEVVCVVGPNGAGKSTLLETLVGLRLPSAGVVSMQSDQAVRTEPLRVAVLQCARRRVTSA